MSSLLDNPTYIQKVIDMANAEATAIQGEVIAADFISTTIDADSFNIPAGDEAMLLGVDGTTEKYRAGTPTKSTQLTGGELILPPMVVRNGAGALSIEYPDKLGTTKRIRMLHIRKSGTTGRITSVKATAVDGSPVPTPAPAAAPVNGRFDF